jgi:hypothetical protein
MKMALNMGLSLMWPIVAWAEAVVAVAGGATEVVELVTPMRGS